MYRISHMRSKLILLLFITSTRHFLANSLRFLALISVVQGTGTSGSIPCASGAVDITIRSYLRSCLLLCFRHRHRPLRRNPHHDHCGLPLVGVHWQVGEWLVDTACSGRSARFAIHSPPPIVHMPTLDAWFPCTCIDCVQVVPPS